MNIKTTLALIVVLAAVAVAALILRDKTASPPPIQNPADLPQTRELLVPDTLIDMDRLTQIDLSLADQVITLKRTDADWQMTSPRQFPASQPAVQELTTLIRSLRAEPMTDAPTSTKTIGAIRLMRDNQLVTLTIGQTLGAGLCRVTLQANGQTRDVVTDNTIHNLLSNLNAPALLARRVATPTALYTQRIDIQSQTDHVTLRKIDNRWYLGETGTDQRALGTFIEGYTSVPGYLNIPTATDILRFEPLNSRDPRPYGLDHPRVTVRYTRTDNTISQLSIGSPADAERKSYFASYRQSPDADPVVFVLPWDFSAVLEKRTDDFRDPRVMETEPGLVRSITLQDSRSQQTLELPVVDPGVAEPEKTTKLRELLKQLAAARADAYLPAAQLTGDPMWTFTIQPRLSDTPETLQVYPGEGVEGQADATCFVVRNNEAIALRVPRGSINLLGQLFDELVIPLP